jgi:hypothetical protein
MLSGELYNPLDPQLSGERRDARLLVKRLNDTRDDQVEERKRLIEKLLPSAGEGVWIERPFSATHPLRAADRRAKREFGARIEISNGLDRWGRDHLRRRTRRCAVCSGSRQCGDKGYTRRCRCSGQSLPSFTENRRMSENSSRGTQFA